MAYRILFLLIASMVSVSAIAQSTDAAAERARLANQRIEAEVERRKHEQEELREEEIAAAPSKSIAAEPVQRAVAADRQAPAKPAAAPPPAASSDDDVSRMLEQLRSLGELKDAGYITEDEFARIKQRILDGTL